MKPAHPFHLCLLTAILLFGLSISLSAATPKLPEKDRICLAETFRLADSLGDQLWKGWAEIPFPVLLVTDSTEFLIRHPKPDTSFIAAGYDSPLKSQIFTRPRRFPTTLLASFPFDDVPTTVIGEPENTEVKTPTPWMITLLHEHFHQFQDSKSDYFEQVDKLNLSGGDKTGMWMLNYAFPYDSADVRQSFDHLTAALDSAVNAPDSLLAARFKTYCAVRHQFMQSLKEPDRKYMSFQLWQEGVARYTELRVAEWADTHYQPSAAFQALADYSPISTRAAMLRQTITMALPKVKLDSWQRVSFYFVGSAEACLLDRVNPSWRSAYFTRMLTLDPYFEE
jgi:hypothetical protein